MNDFFRMYVKSWSRIYEQKDGRVDEIHQTPAEQSLRTDSRLTAFCCIPLHVLLQ